MKRLFVESLLLALVIAAPLPATAGVNVDIRIALPPPIVFDAPPELIVLPETYVYVVPDADVEIFFYSGWWWRPWEGRWYRSRSYSSGWGHYRSVPAFYTEIPAGWRNYYRERRWGEHQWNYQRIPHRQVQQNWRGWEKNKHWEKQQTWGVQGLQPQTRSQQPSRNVEPRSQKARPQVHEPVERQQSRPQPREEVKPQHREAAPQSRGDRPQHSPKQQERQERQDRR